MSMQNDSSVECASDKPLACSVCGNDKGNKRHVAMEMMFGLKDRFDYLECNLCGCVQLIQPPSDLSRYYPAGYYSFQPCYRPVAWKRWLREAWARQSCGNKNALGAAIVWARGTMFPPEWLAVSGIHARSSILDVGCGTGQTLLQLQEAGFTRLEGCDPYISKDLLLGGSIAIHKKYIWELTEAYDFIMMHHSFEHMPDPHMVFSELFRLMRPKAWCLLRIPIASCYAWRHYGVNWVQLDAPRHLFLHTPASIALIAKRSGLNLVRVHYDSSEFQFWGSEQYRLGIPLTDLRSYGIDRTASSFSEGQIDEFRRRAQELNAIGDGDQACFFMCKPA